MNPRERLESNSNGEWLHRLRTLQTAPTPNLQRGRARVLAAAQQRLSASHVPHRLSFAFALAVGVAVIVMMAVMSNTFGTLPVATVAMTRTNTSDAPIALPSGGLTPAHNDTFTLRPPLTPVPNAAPEPPRSPSFPPAQTLLP